METYTEEEPLKFKLGQTVSLQDVRTIVAPANTLDFVEEFRLKSVGRHVTELLRANIPRSEAETHTSDLGDLGAGAILAYLPDR